MATLRKLSDNDAVTILKQVIPDLAEAFGWYSDIGHDHYLYCVNGTEYLIKLSGAFYAIPTSSVITSCQLTTAIEHTIADVPTSSVLADAIQDWERTQLSLNCHDHMSLSSLVNWAKIMKKGRWHEAEQLISSRPMSAVHYAIEVIEGRWPEAEPVITASFPALHNYIVELNLFHIEELTNIMEDCGDEQAMEYFNSVKELRYP